MGCHHCLGSLHRLEPRHHILMRLNRYAHRDGIDAKTDHIIDSVKGNIPAGHGIAEYNIPSHAQGRQNQTIGSLQCGGQGHAGAATRPTQKSSLLLGQPQLQRQRCHGIPVFAGFMGVHHAQQRPTTGYSLKMALPHSDCLVPRKRLEYRQVVPERGTACTFGGHVRIIAFVQREQLLHHTGQ